MNRSQANSIVSPGVGEENQTTQLLAASETLVQEFRGVRGDALVSVLISADPGGTLTDVVISSNTIAYSTSAGVTVTGDGATRTVSILP